MFVNVVFLSSFTNVAVSVKRVQTGLPVESVVTVPALKYCAVDRVKPLFNLDC